MDYEQALQYLHSAPREKGPECMMRMEKLCSLLGSPQKDLKFLHVAGTNGKGSTCAMLAAALQACGYRTGLFISPFISDFRERIQVDGEWIPRRALCEIAAEVRQADRMLTKQGLRATEFELVTACGLLYFQRRGCGIIVLEAGLGGALDATNVIPCPLVSVITKIAMDHTAVLGGTLEEIAQAKSGIIKGGDVVSYPSQDERAASVIARACAQKNAALHIPSAKGADILSCDWQRCRFAYDGILYDIPLGGRHQIDNALAALCTLEVLRQKGYRLAPGKVAQGLARLRFPARLECVQRQPLVLIDGAHNPDGMRALTRALSGMRCTVVFAAMRDKDYPAAARMAAGIARRFIACAPHMPRAAQPQEILSQLCSKDPPAAQLYSAPDCAAALRLALEGLQEGEAIIFCGSLYLASEARALFQPFAPQ